MQDHAATLIGAVCLGREGAAVQWGLTRGRRARRRADDAMRGSASGAVPRRLRQGRGDKEGCEKQGCD